MKGDGCCEGKKKDLLQRSFQFLSHIHLVYMWPPFILTSILNKNYTAFLLKLQLLFWSWLKHIIYRDPLEMLQCEASLDVWCLISKTLQELPPLLIGTLSKDSDSLHLYSLALLYSWVGIHSAKKSTKVIRTSLMCVIKCQDISIVNREVNWSCWLLNSSWNLQDTTGGIIQEIKPVEQSYSKNISKVYWFLCFLDKARIRKCLNSKNSWYNSISNLQRTCHLCSLW